LEAEGYRLALKADWLRAFDRGEEKYLRCKMRGRIGRLTAYLIPSLLLRRVSFLRFKSWKPAWISLMNLLIWRGREKSPSVTALGARRAWKKEGG